MHAGPVDGAWAGGSRFEMLGEVIHGYRVERAISEAKGGFGDVFFATHVDSGAEAVVKVLKPEMSALRDIVTRFFNEARAAASVHHPGIVQIHNVGYHGDRAYLLMERLRGDDLETRLAAGPLPVDRAVLFMRQTAGAIGAAHDRGIVHRDLKPANLFVVADPDVAGGERVKVLDFGIAKLTVDAGVGKTQGVFGTPAYMSPEQCASSAAVDGRADLYSLGCIFYELVCGRPPFGHGGIELIAAHLRDTPLPPRAIAPWLPPAVEQVILRLLEKQPDRRMPSCAALIAALDEAWQSLDGSAASMPHLPVGGALGAARPSPSTLGSAAGAMSMPPPARRGLGVWLGVASVVVVGGAVVAVMAMGGRHPASPQPSRSADAGVVIAATQDAGQIAVAPNDAARMTEVAGDAALVDHGEATPPDSIAAGGAACQGMDVERAMTVAAKRYAAGAPRAALAIVTSALACEQSVQMYRVAATYACAARDVAAAAAYLAKLPPGAQSDVAAHCRLDQVPSQADVAVKLNEEGKAALLDGRYDVAVKKFQEAVAQVPEPKYFLNLGLANYQAGRWDEAVVSLTAVSLNSPSPAVASKASKLLDRIVQDARQRGITLHAFDQAGSATQRPPPDHEAGEAAKFAQAGKIAMAGGHFGDALAQYRHAYELDPRPSLLIEIGRAQYKGGRCKEAKRTCQNLIATWPGDPVVKEAEALIAELGRCD